MMRRKVFELPVGAHSADAFISAQPEVSLLIFNDFINHVISHPILFSIIDKPAFSLWQTAKAFSYCSCPKIAPAVCQERKVYNSAHFVFSSAILAELLYFTVPSVNTPSVCDNPN